MTEVIPEDVMRMASEAATSIYEDAFLFDFAGGSDGQYLDNAITTNIVAQAIMAERARWQPAVTYFERYCQDEAEDVENCVAGQQQHDDAKAFAVAIRNPS